MKCWRLFSIVNLWLYVDNKIPFLVLVILHSHFWHTTMVSSNLSSLFISSTISPTYSNVFILLLLFLGGFCFERNMMFKDFHQQMEISLFLLHARPTWTWTENLLKSYLQVQRIWIKGTRVVDAWKWRR